jgi:hypothetical protein
MSVNEKRDDDYNDDNNKSLMMTDKIFRSEEDSSEMSATTTPPSIGNDQLPVNNSDHPSHEKSAGNDVEKDGAPLDRTHSQAQKLGKKKILIIMPALCVCILYRYLPAAIELC